MLAFKLNLMFHRWLWTVWQSHPNSSSTCRLFFHSFDLYHTAVVSVSVYVHWEQWPAMHQISAYQDVSACSCRGVANISKTPHERQIFWFGFWKKQHSDIFKPQLQIELHGSIWVHISVISVMIRFLSNPLMHSKTKFKKSRGVNNQIDDCYTVMAYWDTWIERRHR